MKPIIVEMKDMSDSTEVYESRPNRFMIYTIYAVLFLLLTAFVWMYVSKIEIVVKSNGIFRCEEEVFDVSSGVTGEIQSCHIKDGQAVQKGDVLFVVNVETLGTAMETYQNELENLQQRLEMLAAYEKSLDENAELPISLSENKYYQEFVNRKQLLLANMNSNSQDTEEQRNTCQTNINHIEESIAEYQTKKEKLKQVRSNIISRTNVFAETDSYYYSIVTSYLSNYDLTASQYDAQIKEYQKQVEEYEKNLLELENENMDAENTKEAEENINNQNILFSGENISASEGNFTNNTNNQDSLIQNLKKEKEAVENKIVSIKKEKEQALSNLELQQISSIEQQIQGVEDTLLSLNSNLSSAKLQLNSLENTDVSTAKEIQILTEKGNIAAEILSYQSKKEECENYLKNYDIQDHNCKITASNSGYFYLQQDIKQGSYVQEGSSIGKIYPEQTSKYYAEIYVENQDVAKLEEGKRVNFEIAAYPSDEYGYFTGKIENISKDITVTEDGSAYYLVRTSCDNSSVRNKKGEIGNLMNGMACQAKIVVEEERVFHYLLRKIDLLD